MAATQSATNTGEAIRQAPKRPFCTLTRYEYLLLKTLMLAPGRVYSRQQLMDLVWQDAEESLDRTVDTHIKTLRAKLRERDPDANLILTHRGLGYSLELA